MPRRVLVVDDDEMTREILATVLDLEDYDVVAAGSGEEALGMLDAHPVDVVVLDLMMPGLTGFEVCRRVRAHPSHAQVPVILLTASDSADDRRHGSDVGADAYITKPFSPLALLERIDQMTGSATVNGAS